MSRRSSSIFCAAAAKAGNPPDKKKAYGESKQKNSEGDHTHLDPQLGYLLSVRLFGKPQTQNACFAGKDRPGDVQIVLSIGGIDLFQAE
jgi:hypothetical protein